MGNEELQERLSTLAPEATFEAGNSYLELTIPSGPCRSLLQLLRSEDDLSFDFLFCQTGVDLPESMRVVYHIRSTTHGHNLVVKAEIDTRENPQIETVSDIWRTAEFHEREIYDLFGIVFLDHPDLRRIFLEDDWVGWPCRKDYVDEINVVEL